MVNYITIIKYFNNLDIVSTRIIKEFPEKEEMILNIIEITVNDTLINNKKLLEALFFECHCAIFLIDITSEESIEGFKDLITNLEFNEIIIKDDYKYISQILVINKTDLKSGIDKNKELIKEFLNSHPFFSSVELSLKELKGISELTQKIFDSYKKKENMIYPIDKIKEYESQSNDIIQYSKLNIEGSISCILIGDSETGKSSFLLRYFKNKYSERFLMTIGLDKEAKIIKIIDKEIKFILWDTAGQERFKSLPGKYLQNAEGIFLLFDVHKRESFNNVKKWVEDIKVDINNKKVNMYLIGNKIDLEREVSKEEGMELAADLGMKYFESSNKINVNINEIISHMIMDCYPNMKINDRLSIQTKGVNLKKQTKKKKKKFC